MNNKSVGAVILSRYNSNRLPGKALMEIRDKPILLYIVERLLKVLPKSKIVVATSDQASDDAIASFCKNNGINCFRGSLENVAQRFYEAGLSLKSDYIARINGDNIFMDIPLMKEMVSFASTGEYEFISNVKGRTYPKGMSIEIVSLQHFRDILPEINQNADYREHVTLYLYQNEKSTYKFVYNGLNKSFWGVQLALDTLDDFERTRKIMNHFKKDHTFYNMMEIFAILKDLKT